MNRIRIFLFLLVVSLAIQPLLARGKKASAIRPGLTVMTEEESRIEADPEAGIEHAVILVEETELNDDARMYSRTRFHLRAKILSNEGRELSNIELPYVEDNNMLVEWWGRTILPDGTVLELTRRELDSQVLAKVGREEFRSLKATLRGVVPGCVIDYGYEIKSEGFAFYNRVPLQRAYPIKKFLYHWVPLSGLQGAYFMVHGSSGPPIDVDVTTKHITVTATDLPHIKEEEYMPPRHAVQAAVIFYYMYGTNYDSFWDDLANQTDRSVTARSDKTKYLNQAAEVIGIDHGAPVETSLRTVYEWMTANITRQGLKSFEEIEDKGEEGKDRVGYVRQILEAREGSSYEMAAFFLALARHLGCEAYLVYASDRTENYWAHELKTKYQFDTTLVGVRKPGDPEKEYTVVDPGSGLPYGEIPWFYSGVSGLLLKKSGAETIKLRPSPLSSSVSETMVSINFAEENEIMVCNWATSGRGQVGLDERRYLRQLSPEDRVEEIEEFCSIGPESEVVTAQVGDLHDLTADYRLECEAEDTSGDLDETIGHYSLDFGGPWIQAVPDLTGGDRTHMVIFRFPRADITRMDVSSPAGFAPRNPPAPVTFEGPFGKYVLSINRTAKGYHLERLLALYRLSVPVEEYDGLVEFLDNVRRADRTALEFERIGS